MITRQEGGDQLKEEDIPYPKIRKYLKGPTLNIPQQVCSYKIDFCHHEHYQFY